MLGATGGVRRSACLIENQVSFVQYAPVLDALRSIWTPACDLTLPFSEALLAGQLVRSQDEEAFRRIGSELGVPASLDEYQLKAYEHVTRYQLALVQGPPGR
eukprot:85622-Pyramimonas_sp.AAC.1